MACSRVCQLKDLLFHHSVSFQRLASLVTSQSVVQRKAEDQRLMYVYGICAIIIILSGYAYIHTTMQ